MKDRRLLWSIIVALALLIVAQLLGQGAMKHWQRQSDQLSKPDPATVQKLSQTRPRNSD